MFSNLPQDIQIVEVGPRDGLQNEKKSLPLTTKLEFIERLTQTGLTKIEATSFVRADKIPQMADAENLFSEINEKFKDLNIDFPCLVPNLKGYEIAKKVNVKEISLFSATSSEFTKKNINCTIDESFVRMRELAKTAHSDGKKIRAYISTAFGCPYAGKMTSKELISVIEKFLELDVYEISIGDTIGVATPKQVYDYIQDFKTVVSLDKVAMHFHDTRGMAIANILTSLETGIRVFDSSAGGLGGCPYAKGATGNVATEDLVYLCESLGLSTGVDLDKLLSASQFILSAVEKESPSKYFQTLVKR